MAKQINLVINGKGGLGKSFFATNFVQYLKDRGIAHRAIDSDHENSTLKRFHPDFDFINLEQRREIDHMFIATESADLLVIDCRAASTDLFIDFFDEVGLLEVLRTIDARLTSVSPVNHEADSVEQLRILSDALGDMCGWVVVKNEAHSETFKLYENSKTRRHLLDALHAREISMPCLHDWLVVLLNEHNVPLTAALQHPGFSLLDRQRLKHWQVVFYKEVGTASDLPCPRAVGLRMSADDPLAVTISDWQRKHRIADGDPMIAALELVRIYLRHAREVDDKPGTLPPSFEDFRSTIELLDRRSKSFVQQAIDFRLSARTARAMLRSNVSKEVTIMNAQKNSSLQ
jgi:hypothetical protein